MPLHSLIKDIKRRPGILLPDDFLNFTVAAFLVAAFNIDKLVALAFTYTILPISLILAGAMIYPYNTKRLLNGKVNKARAYAKKIITTPSLLILTIVGVFIMWILFNLYMNYLSSTLGW